MNLSTLILWKRGQPSSDTELASGAIRYGAYCIQCRCHDDAACVDRVTGLPCSWLRLDRAHARGVCSACSAATARWDAGDRTWPGSS